MEESKMEYIEEVREAYERTLKFAADAGADEFRCGYLECRHCPFVTSKGVCDDDGVLRTVAEWQQWWYERTGERDTRTKEQILTVKAWQQTEETVQPTEDTADTSGEDTLQPVEPTVPNVDIIWTTAMGAVKHRAGPIALLGGEMQKFSRDVGCWISEMSKPDTCSTLADSITFVARDETGAVLANVELFAELFGKRKVWESLER